MALASNDTFEETVKLIHENCINRFHPTLPVLVSGSTHLTFFDAKDGITQFSNWNERQCKLKGNVAICSIEWNVDGTKLAAAVADPNQLFVNDCGDESGEIIVWNYPTCDILFQQKQFKVVHEIEWNQFRQEVFATYNIGDPLVSLWTTKDLKRNLFYVFDFDRENRFREFIMKVKWISESEVALGLNNGTIEIYRISESHPVTAPQITRKLKHDRVVRDMKWSCTTQYLASFSWDNTIKIWSVDNGLNGELIHGLHVNSSCYIYSFAWRTNRKTYAEIDIERESPENFIVACGLRHEITRKKSSNGSTGPIVIWNPLERDESKQQRILEKHKCSVSSLAFSPDGQFLASSDAIDVIIWSTETWMPVFVSQYNKFTQDQLLKSRPLFNCRLSWMALGSTTAGGVNKLTYSSIDNKVGQFVQTELKVTRNIT
ncbi:F-box-like/WD repeat-containing protein TBL1Y isoform X2 [Daphnia pulex]|uniref:F-box-like/WD repeat-containing protein TBL1Y isoform X2 n=1 Tax=Daphnia pulex TaxID=6669 RepID=UPI001EDDD776|nr:F-box-like/WD repeat-containing protein TBL1Y isoform X2 [Daphnia pulex]